MKEIFRMQVVQIIACLICLAGSVTQAKLIALYEFESKDARDSCSDNHGVLNGIPVWETGPRGIALKLDGREYVSIPNGQNFNFTNQMTVAAWIKVNKFDKTFQAIITKGDDAWRLHRTVSKDTLDFVCTRAGKLSGKTPVNDDKWHHVAGVYDGSKIYLYIDGVLDASFNSSKGIMGANGYDVCIGENLQSTNRCWNGLIDDVALFDDGLSADDIAQLFKYGGVSFVPKVHMTKVVEEVETAIKERQTPEAIAFLENKITESRKWIETNLSNVGSRDKSLFSDLYFLLGKTKLAASLSKDEVAIAYKEAIFSSTNGVTALIWLYENIPTEQFTSIVKNVVQNNEKAYSYIVRQFEASGNWPAFEAFLNVVFDSVDDTVAAGNSIECNLKEVSWGTKYLDYCKKKPQLAWYVFERDCRTAEEQVAKKEFRKAAEIYRDLAKQQSHETYKSTIKFRIGKCLFNAGEYANAITELDQLITENKATCRELAIKSMLLKGQCYIQLGQVDKASNEFLSFMIEYPNSEESPEASFFVGYCYMLQSKFQQAKDALNLVVKNYPESSFANKARLCLTRIESMTQ